MIKGSGEGACVPTVAGDSWKPWQWPLGSNPSLLWEPPLCVAAVICLLVLWEAVLSFLADICWVPFVPSHQCIPVSVCWLRAPRIVMRSGWACGG